MSKFKYPRNQSWEFLPNAAGGYDSEQLANILLQDIRNQLIKLNSLLHCHNAQDIPKILRGIRTNTAKRKKKKP